METINQTQQQPFTNRQLPNSTAVLVLGILSIVLCFCWGIIGVTLGIIALVLANKANALYIENPGVYSEGSYKNMKAGKVCAIVGTSLSGIYMLFTIISLSIVGTGLATVFSTMPWETFK
jgi:hypothetical protein